MCVATIVGFATAVRPVGVALLLPLAWYAAAGKHGFAPRLRRLGWAMPLGCWGLAAYMLYQAIELGEPLAFAKTQTHWRIEQQCGAAEKALSLASWEPIWSVYLPGTCAYFGNRGDNAWVHAMRPYNPMFFVGTVALIAAGAWKGWLTTNEVLLSIPLLAIPYVTRAYEMCMESQGRFAAVVLPAYIVMGHLLARLPRAVSVLILASSGLVLAFFASGFAAGDLFF